MRIPAIGQAEAERIAQLIEEMTVEEEEAEPQPVPGDGGEAADGGGEPGDAGAEGLTPGGEA
jgi:hypothetical protein